MKTDANVSSKGEKDMAQEDKLKALDAALAQIEKQFGKGSVMKLGDSGANHEYVRQYRPAR